MYNQQVRTTQTRVAIAHGIARLIPSLLVGIELVIGAASLPAALAQDPAADTPSQPTGMVRLNFPQEIPIQTLVEYVSQRLGINILFDKEMADKRINIKAANEIPAESLLGVLESALKISGLALVDAEVPGWKKIVKAEQLPNVAPAGEADDALRQYGDATALTQAFVLKHANPQEVEQLIKPFLTQPGANVVPVPRSNTLIVTDYASNLVKIAKWVESIDQPKASVTVEFVPVEHQSVTELTTQLTTILSAKSRARGVTEAIAEVEIVPDQHTNQMLVIGPPATVQEVKELVKSLDKPLGLMTKTYQFTHVRATKIDELVRALLMPGAGDHLYRTVTDDVENLMIVTAPDSVHEQIDQLRRVRDVALSVPESPIRFYKIKNLPVQELLETIRSIENNTFADFPQQKGWSQLPTDGRIRPARSNAVPGPNQLPGPAGTSELPVPPAVVVPRKEAVPAVDDGAAVAAPSSELLGRARITGDIHSNTLIIVAEPSVHRLYEELIKKLDQPRPQVMVEAKFVIIDTSDDFSLGVEVSAGDRSGLKRLLAFSSYGLSTVDPVSGALSIIPGLAFNGTLVDPDTADVVTRALVAHRRARVTSAPRILVSDNATGQLTSVEEVPFTSVNASQTVATTSFAGFADAGTTITVTPRIRDESSLQLEIAITVNTFTGAGSAGVPPPRQTEEVTSQVIIPDGHTVILGGLNRGSKSYDYKGLPLLNRIPIVRELTGLTTTARAGSSMFVFLRPVILQDDKFKDLRYISESDARSACLPPDYPAARPIWMR
ncbi:MAG: secretin N-terminal domain-containing protein [Pirellulaceae bacterium]